MIDDFSSIVTIIVGEGVLEEEVNAVVEAISSKHDDIEVEVRNGEQPVYSFIIGVE